MTRQETSKNSILKKTKKLSVQFSLNGLSFLSLNDKREAIFIQEKLEQGATPEELLSLCKQSLVANKLDINALETVEIHYASSLYTLVPLSLFDEKRCSDYLKFNSKILATDFIAHDVIDSIDIVVVYVPFININNFFFDAVGNFSYYHHISKFLHKSAAVFKSKTEDTILINVRDKEFDIVIYSNQSLQICNSYAYQTPEDFLYYILFTFEQLKIKPDKATVQIIGHQFEKSDLFSISEKYINTLIFLDGNFKTMTTSQVHHPTQQVLSNL